MVNEFPDKPFYKIGEVCQYTDTQPYVLRFWESEFPQLAPEKNRNGQRVYRRQDVELILRIKKLLYEEEYTIAGARRKLESGEEDRSGDGPPPAPPSAVAPAAVRLSAAAAAAFAEAEVAPAPARRGRDETASESRAPDAPSGNAIEDLLPAGAARSRSAADDVEEALDRLRRELSRSRDDLRRSEAGRAAAEAELAACRRRMERAAGALEAAVRGFDGVASEPEA